MTTNLLLATTMTPELLLWGPIGTSDAAVYTCPALSSVKIATAVICNVTSSTATVFIGHARSGDTAGVGHHVVHGYQLKAGESVSLTPYLGGAMLTAGDFITGYSGTASAVNLTLTGTVSA
ncbi:hypothetical protein [Nocardia sp. NBC_01327]|uniref:hypothetical protein n=1 Tax=Nocardia sp. NBC_01327 TaxID=2903593 RepID=UPI002E10ED17|nr:hypothetical protein OG326_23925 [Nocardia sp. NBC_01327]